MNEKSFRQFITDRPALNLPALAEELSMDRVNLLKIIAGLRKFPQARRGHFLSVAQKYGYRVEIQQ